MVYFVSVVFCKQIVVDERTKSTVYINDMTGVISKFATVPAPLPDFFVATVWGRESAEDAAGTMRISLVHPSEDKNKNKAAEIDIPFKDGDKISKVNVQIENLLVSEFGEYFLTIEFRKSKRAKWETKSKFPFYVQKMEVPEPKPEKEK